MTTAMEPEDHAMPTAHRVFERMTEFVQDAARIALDLRAAGLSVTHKGDGFGQALTAADEAISRLMVERFGPRLIEEETALTMTREAAKTLVADGSAWTFVGDPIDGTAPFAGGLSGWGIMLAACRDGWPQTSALILPVWRNDPVEDAAVQRGVFLGAIDGVVLWAPTEDGRLVGTPQPLRPAGRPTGHIGWLCVAAQNYTLDYGQGLFPYGVGGSITDIAALAWGLIEASTFNAYLWDLAPAYPILRALGFDLFRWPDLAPPAGTIVDLFDERFACHPDLWLVARSRDAAARCAAAIRRADGPQAAAGRRAG